jgi:hypothetical protein
MAEIGRRNGRDLGGFRHLMPFETWIVVLTINSVLVSFLILSPCFISILARLLAAPEYVPGTVLESQNSTYGPVLKSTGLEGRVSYYYLNHTVEFP